MITDNKKETFEETNEPIKVTLYTRLKDEYTTKLESRAAIDYTNYRNAKEILKSEDNFSNLKLDWLTFYYLCEALCVPMEQFPTVFK